MKHHIVQPAALTLPDPAARPQHPEKLAKFAEDPLPESRDMRQEQRAAFKSPSHEEMRVLRSQGEQGRT